jgi:GT2 family glycosyltransferase
MSLLSIIIVNWNSVKYLRNCLTSIVANTRDAAFEIIVVDNASYDGCDEMLKVEFPAVKFIQSTENLGFAAANNLGFSQSLGDNLLFLNPDTEVIGTSIDVMLSQLQGIPDAGAVGCKLLNPDRSVQTTCIQPFPTIMNQLLDTDFLILRFPGLKLWGVRPLFFYKGTPEPVEVISGACIMTKRGAFEKAGRFTTDYFMYAEDVDLCYKIRRVGFKAYYVGEVSIVHYGGASANSTDVSHFNTVVKRESVALFFEKYRGKLVSCLYRISTGFASIVRLSVVTVLFPLGAVSQRMQSLNKAFVKWTKVLRWSLGLEKWAGRLGRGRVRTG